jgi:hypothetical protein
MTLLSLASKQIWPQVLAIAHLKPDRVFLLHSEEAGESKDPAQRLKRFFDDAEPSLLPQGATRLESIPHDDFAAIERLLDALPSKQQLILGDCVLNFTGGNKLMATAAFRWAAKRGVRALYLERGNQITWFEPRDGDMKTRSERLDASATNKLDAAALLSCQFGDEVLQSSGERLNLNQKGQNAASQDLAAKLQGETRLDRNAFDFRRWLTIEDPSPRESNEGNNLEYGTACALLKTGLSAVRRGVELSTLPNSTNTEAELDLVFNWNGRLWVVDCKDRVGGDAKVESLKTLLLGDGCCNRQTEVLLKSIAEDLKDRDIKILREDLLQISEVGGLLGCALAVRSSKPPQQAVEYAASRHPHVEILLKSDLVKRLPAILAGRRPRRSAKF